MSCLTGHGSKQVRPGSSVSRGQALCRLGCGGRCVGMDLGDLGAQGVWCVACMAWPLWISVELSPPPHVVQLCTCAVASNARSEGETASWPDGQTTRRSDGQTARRADHTRSHAISVGSKATGMVRIRSRGCAARMYSTHLSERPSCTVLHTVYP